MRPVFAAGVYGVLHESLCRCARIAGFWANIWDAVYALRVGVADLATIDSFRMFISEGVGAQTCISLKTYIVEGGGAEREIDAASGRRVWSEGNAKFPCKSCVIRCEPSNMQTCTWSTIIRRPVDRTCRRDTKSQNKN
eukprot:4337205-Amphidinium_carterae.1